MGALLVVLAVPVLVAGCTDGATDEEARQRLAAVGGSGEAATGSGSGDADGAAQLDDVVVVAGPVADVDVRDNTFGPENIQVSPGARIVWTNNGRQDHDIVPVDDGGWGVEPADFAADAVYEHTFDQPGTYRYYCSLHGTAEAGMTGAVVVE